MKERNFLVVGGRSGIGLEIVKRLAPHGCRLDVLARGKQSVWMAGCRRCASPDK